MYKIIFYEIKDFFLHNVKLSKNIKKLQLFNKNIRSAFLRRYIVHHIIMISDVYLPNYSKSIEFDLSVEIIKIDNLFHNL